ncbi:MAG TPA: HEAT repeat domain-containing protein [Planctomycetota bacterium]|nr:HEAT repeat domain-containing protein [Planctomycetota bacterium]
MVFIPRGSGSEILDNPKLIEMISGGLSPKVVMATIKDAGKECHFTASVKDKLAIQKACLEATPKWTDEETNTLQLKILELAQQTVKDLKNQVQLFLTSAENNDDTDNPEQYRELKNRLIRSGKVAVPFLLEHLSEDSPRKRRAILEVLADIGDKSDEIVQACRTKLDDTAPPVRAQAAKAVAALAGPETGEQLITMLNRRDNKNDAVALALGYMRYANAIEPLVTLLKTSRDADEKICAAFALGDMRAKTHGAPEALLEAILDDRDEKLRYTAAKAAALIGDRRTPQHVISAYSRLRGKQGSMELLEILGYFKSLPAANFLLELMDSNVNDLELHKLCKKTLVVMTGDENSDTTEQWRALIDNVLSNIPEWKEPKEPGKLPEPDQK